MEPESKQPAPPAPPPPPKAPTQTEPSKDASAQSTTGQRDEKNPHNIDLGNILLPKKEVHDPTLAQRASAGVLLAQEKSATLAHDTDTTKDTSKDTDKAANTKEAESVTPKGEAGEKKNHVAPLETYKGDIEKYVREKNVSVVSAAAAEIGRKDTRAFSMKTAGATETSEAPTGHSWLWYGAVVGGAMLVLVSLGLLLFVLAKNNGALPAAVAPQAPFIAVDAVADAPITQGEARQDVIDELTKTKDASPLALGLIEQVRPYLASSTDPNGGTLLGAEPFLALIAPSIPPNLLRTLGPTFLLGVHTFSTPQPFFILKTDSYEEAFAGMLAWEVSMRSDLLPLFAYTPTAHINTTAPDASAPTDQAQTQNPAGAFTPSNFVDAVVENHDARVLRNQAGDIYFLWTFLDRSTIVITTNEYTLREVISRLKDAPILTQPGQ